MRWTTIFVLFLTASITVYMVYVLHDTKQDLCADYCYPRASDLMDATTCACWGDKIEVVNIVDIK